MIDEKKLIEEIRSMDDDCVILRTRNGKWEKEYFIKLIENQPKVGEWIPSEYEVPPDDDYVLLSFANFTIPIVGRYEQDEDGGGAFYAGDEDETLLSQDIIVNAWMKLPKPYIEGGANE